MLALARPCVLQVGKYYVKRYFVVGMIYLGFQSSSGVHHSVGDFRSIEIERDLGDSVTWVVLTITRSINWHIY